MNVFLSSKAVRQLKKLPESMHEVIIDRIEKLSGNPFPSGGKKLENRPGWRFRIGDYRVLYTVDKEKKEVTILSVAHRKEAYKY
ncbi:MAG: type II toxin-antitoxin system RelE/ParE family toxin [Patescibacteria group bacterium]|nr:type II toxin-antitoxin system RelE/ParE family toxin [Patescibacteria group bacterium]